MKTKDGTPGSSGLNGLRCMQRGINFTISAVLQNGKYTITRAIGEKGWWGQDM